MRSVFFAADRCKVIYVYSQINLNGMKELEFPEMKNKGKETKLLAN